MKYFFCLAPCSGLPPRGGVQPDVMSSIDGPEGAGAYPGLEPRDVTRLVYFLICKVAVIYQTSHWF